MTISEKTGLNPEFIRTEMQNLKSLQLIEGIVGSTGAYKPTPAAYEALNIQQKNNPSSRHC